MNSTQPNTSVLYPDLTKVEDLKVPPSAPPRKTLIKNVLKHDVEPTDNKGSQHNQDESNSPIIGIDLGTTFSCAAIYWKGRVNIIPNDNGKSLTPSYAYYSKDDEPLVGDSAYIMLKNCPKNTVYDMKRIIGKSGIDDVIEQNEDYWTFKIKQDHQLRPVVEIIDEDEIIEVKPEEVSAEILKYIRTCAENFTGISELNQAVITVPAYFNQAQKQMTLTAAKIAGLDVKDWMLITEPAAAAYAFKYEQNVEYFDEKNLLVFDLGGGTFDIVIIRAEGGRFTVKWVDGDTNLGGRDFDNKLMDYLREKIKEKHGKDAFTNPLTKQKLLRECKEMKEQLSKPTSQQARLYLGDLFSSVDEEHCLKREEFEKICEELFIKIEQIIHRAVKGAKMKSEDIDEILMVGGSSRVLKVQEILKSIFPNKPLNKTESPDEVVAKGAAVYAAKFLLKEQGDVKNSNLDTQLDNVHSIMEVTPHAFGTDLAGGLFGVVLPKNTPIPACEKVERATAYSNQTCMEFKIYEGVKKIAVYNKCLGKMFIDGIKPGPAGQEIVQVIFSLDRNGLLEVTATYNEKMTRLQIDYNAESGTESYEPEMDEGSVNDDDTMEFEMRSARVQLSATLERIHYDLEHSKFSNDEKEILLNVHDEVSKWLSKNPRAAKDEFDKQRTKMNSLYVGIKNSGLNISN